MPIIPFLANNQIYDFLLFNSAVLYTAKIGKDSKFVYGCIVCVVHSKNILVNE